MWNYRRQCRRLRPSVKYMVALFIHEGGGACCIAAQRPWSVQSRRRVVSSLTLDCNTRNTGFLALSPVYHNLSPNLRANRASFLPPRNGERSAFASLPPAFCVVFSIPSHPSQSSNMAPTAEPIINRPEHGKSPFALHRCPTSASLPRRLFARRPFAEQGVNGSREATACTATLELTRRYLSSSGVLLAP